MPTMPAARHLNDASLRNTSLLSGLAPCCPHADGGVEILIALCSPGCPASRAFLPRRLLDAGPSRQWRGSAWAGIRNPSHLRTRRCDKTLATVPSAVDLDQNLVARPLCRAIARLTRDLELPLAGSRWAFPAPQAFAITALNLAT